MRNFFAICLVILLLAACAAGARAEDFAYLPWIANDVTPTPAPIAPTSAPAETATSTPTADVVATSVAATLTALAPTATATQTSTATPSPTATQAATQTAVPPTATATPSPTPTIELIPPHGAQHFFGFEFGIEGWHTSEADSGKRAVVTAVNAPVHSGNAALALDTVLRGNTTDLDHHTEAKVYFASSNMEGQHSQIWIYIPGAVLSGDDGDNEPGYVEILHYVVAEGHRNQYDPRVRLDSTMVNRWILLDLAVGVVEQDGHIDGGFDPKKIIGGGVRFEAYGDFDFSGIVAFVDDAKFGIEE